MCVATRPTAFKKREWLVTLNQYMSIVFLLICLGDKVKPPTSTYGAVADLINVILAVWFLVSAWLEFGQQVEGRSGNQGT